MVGNTPVQSPLHHRECLGERQRPERSSAIEFEQDLAAQPASHAHRRPNIDVEIRKPVRILEWVVGIEQGYRFCNRGNCRANDIDKEARAQCDSGPRQPLIQLRSWKISDDHTVSRAASPIRSKSVSTTWTASISSASGSIASLCPIDSVRSATQRAAPDSVSRLNTNPASRFSRWVLPVRSL